MKAFEWNQQVRVVGMNGVTTIDVKLTFDVPPATYSPSMKLIVTKELQDAVQHMVEDARKA